MNFIIVIIHILLLILVCSVHSNWLAAPYYFTLKTVTNYEKKSEVRKKAFVPEESKKSQILSFKIGLLDLIKT